MGQLDSVSYRSVLTHHRELLVSRLRSIQCVVDNLSASGFFCQEEAEMVLQTATKTDQVRKILELVQCKGEEASEYFIYIIHQVCDAYIDLQPWLKEIDYVPSEEVKGTEVVNTDPISRYCEKLRHDLNRDTSFIMSYGQREETRLDELYTDTLMELLNDVNESLGFLETLDQLLGDQGIFNPDGEIVYVMGDAGIGKSILLQKLQNVWSKKELRTDAVFFFKFRCRMFNVFRDAEQISLRDLLFKYNCYPDRDADDEVFDYIQRFPGKVIFTFDGYDEVQEALDRMDVPEVVSPEDLANPLQLLLSLLSGKLLKGSQKVLTARTGVDFQSKVIKKKVALRGFSPDHLRSYVGIHFREQEQQELVWVQLDASPHLCGLCSTPLFCWIILNSFMHLHAVHDDFELPQSCITLTDIFLLLCEVFLSHSAAPSSALHRKSTRCAAETFRGGLITLEAFANLALWGTETRRFVFSQEEVAACGLTEDELSLGFLRASGGDGRDHNEGGAMFEFLHLTLQSFLAAFALILNTETASSSILRFFTECSHKRSSSCLPLGLLTCGSSQVSGKSPFAPTEHLQFTNLFLCGLLSKAHTGLMDHLVSPTLLKKKRSVLKSYLSTSVKSHLRSLPLCESLEGMKLHVMPNVVWMLRCIFEAGSKEIALLTAKGITANYIKLGYCNLFSEDCTALNFVLQHRRKLLGVDMDNNNIGDYGVKQLRPSFPIMTVVRFCVNNLTDSSIEVLAEELCKHKVVEVLGLYNNHITDVGAKLVAKIIEECPKLRIVKIGKNKITTIGGKYLARAVQKNTSIFDLGMWGNSIGDEGAEAFAEALRCHPSLTNLSLSANNITSRGGKSLAEALKENNKLRIFWLVQNELTDDVAPYLADLVRANTGLSHLWLISNCFTEDGLRLLAEALPHNTTLKEICVKSNQLTKEEEKQFAAEKRLRFY